MPLFVLPFPNIDPVLVQIGPFGLRWYALGYIAGIFLGWWYARSIVANQRLWGAAGSPMTPRHIDDFVLYATIGIVVGGRLGYVLVYNLPQYLAQPLEIFALWDGGMSFHGGFIGTALAMIVFAWRYSIPTWSLIDVIAPSSTIGIFLVRIANFINGELYGRASDVPWAIVFPRGGPEPRHPSQLYEAGLEGLLLFLITWFLIFRARKLRFPGFMAGAFTAGYGAFRTFVEFFRQPDIQMGDGGFLTGGLTTGMLLSVPMFIAGVAVMIWASRRGERPAPASAS